LYFTFPLGSPPPPPPHSLTHSLLLPPLLSGQFRGNPAEANATLLVRLKSLAQLAKEIIDAVHEWYPDPPPTSGPLTEDDLIDEYDTDETPRCTGQDLFPFRFRAAALTLTLSFSSLTNHSCHQVIEKNMSTLKFADTLWHPDCFVCKSCSKKVQTADFLIMEGQPVCHACSPKCARCKLPVTQGCVTAVRKYFHATCFSCDGCGKVIGNTSKFYQKNGHPCCSLCVSRHSVFEHGRNPRSAVFFDDDEDVLPAGGHSGAPPPAMSQNNIPRQLQPTSASEEYLDLPRTSIDGDDLSIADSDLGSAAVSTSLNTSVHSAPSRPSSHSPSNPRCLEG